jgi:hypothetical protein
VATAARPHWATRWFLLGFPPLVALAVWWEGQHYDPGLIGLDKPAAESPQGAASPMPSGLLGRPRAGAVRTYDRANLYEYVNGHAEYYIGAGFQRLLVAEYGPDPAAPGVVVDVFDMGRPVHAFGVLADEAAGGQPLPGDPAAFPTGSGIALAHGSYYVRASLFDETLDPATVAAEIRRALGGDAASSPGDLAFPPLGTVLGTRLVKESYRGMEALSNVMERRFDAGGRELVAFLIEEDAAATGRRVADLLAFFEGDGIGYASRAIGRVTVHTVADRYEGDWFFWADGGRLTGVLAPLDDALAAVIARHQEEGR